MLEQGRAAGKLGAASNCGTGFIGQILSSVELKKYQVVQDSDEAAYCRETSPVTLEPIKRSPKTISPRFYFDSVCIRPFITQRTSSEPTSIYLLALVPSALDEHEASTCIDYEGSTSQRHSYCSPNQ
jgi:hypothetical protein